MVYSFSSLTEYEACPYSFYLRKKEGIKGDTNGSAEIGSYAHKLLEDIIKGIKTVTQALDDCVENFYDYITDDKMSYASKEKKYIELCDYLSSLKSDTLRNYKTLGVEQLIFWDLGDYRMCGVIDLILKDKTTNEVVLVDHKSSPHFLKKDGSPLKSQLQSFEKYKKQMYLYAYAMKQKYGYFPDKIVWNHFLDGGAVTVIQFNEADMQKTLDWAKGMIERIEKDREFAACQDDFLYCNRFCGYRNGICEYKGLEEPD